MAAVPKRSWEKVRRFNGISLMLPWVGDNIEKNASGGEGLRPPEAKVGQVRR
jgi:hypothetical protein